MDKNYSKDEIYSTLCEILQTEFEIDPSIITMESNLYEDLDLDSIDAVDLAVRLQQFTDKRISPEEFKQIRTINDVVEAVFSLL